MNLPRVSGRKDEQWLMVCVKEVQIHLIIEGYREELDLEFRFLNDPPPEMINKWKLYQVLKKKSANLEVNEDTFKRDRTTTGDI